MTDKRLRVALAKIADRVDEPELHPKDFRAFVREVLAETEQPDYKNDWGSVSAADDPAVQKAKEDANNKKELLLDWYKDLGVEFNRRGIASGKWAILERLYTAAIDGVDARMAGFMDGVIAGRSPKDHEEETSDD